MYFQPYENMYEGTWTMASLPTAAPFIAGRMAYVTDRPGGAGFMECLNGVAWVPCRKRMEVYSGTTNGSGNYTVTYSTPFASTPDLNPKLLPGADTETNFRITSESATGFTINTYRRSSLTVLGINLLSFATAAAAGVSVRVLVVEA